MDKQTSKILSEITANIPQHLTENLTREVVDTSQEDVAKEALKNPRVPAAQKKQLRNLLRKGAFRTSETEVNEEAVAALDAYHTTEIAKARRSGRLADPKNDKWLQRRNKRIQARRVK